MASPGSNRKLYFYEGKELKLDNQEIPFYHSVEVDSDAELVLESGSDISNVLLLQGKPINEPIVQHGPFVMNTREEIRQAFDDYQKNQFGGWPWKKQDPVHPRETRQVCNSC